MSMHYIKKFKRTYYILLLPAALLLTFICSFYPQTVEQIYATSINRTVVSVLSQATGIIPFSLSEIIIISLLSWVACIIVRRLVIRKKVDKPRLGLMLKNILAGASLIYFSFILLWGLNYYRMPFAKIANLPVEPASETELEEVCRNLVTRTNYLRSEINEDQEGVMQLSLPKDKVLDSAAAGFTSSAALYPELGGSYGAPKAIILSEVLSYGSLAGFYFPFSGEANVNMAIPDAMLPSTACHEAAHQRGFAREDEANYIAYLSCRLNPNPEFQYSGTLLAMTIAMNTLKRCDAEKYASIKDDISEGVRRDLDNNRAYWDRHQTLLGEISNTVNDFYLKSNRQKDGLYSYDRMVELLVGEFRVQKQVQP